MKAMNKVTQDLINAVSSFRDNFKGAFNIRADGQCVGRRSTKNIQIQSREDGTGLLVTIAAGTMGEKVYIPVCVTRGNIDDVAYNDFYIGEGADVEIEAGCGVSTFDEGEARHNGVHKFIIGKGARVVYREKHVGGGSGSGVRAINPVTEAILSDGAVFEIDTVQIGGVDSTVRVTSATLGAGAKIIVRERIMTEGDERAETDFNVILDGEDSGADLVSRSVARGKSHQIFRSSIAGRNRCAGHSACDALLSESGTVAAIPALEASHPDAALIHEAAIGKIAGEQILKLKTLGLTDEEAEERIISGFLR